MSNVALQIVSILAASIAPTSNVIFDTTMYSSGNIDYSPASGFITLNEIGRYVINWWVTTQSSVSPGVNFALISSQGDQLVGNSPLKTGQVSGNGIIDVVTAPVTLSLANFGPDPVFLSTSVVNKASLTVIQDAVSEEPATDMKCFAVRQLSHLLSQMIASYGSTTWSIFSQSLASYSGVPLDLYTSPNGTEPAFLRLVDENGDYETLSIMHIAAIFPGSGTVYNPSFTYLDPPAPLPQSCDNDLISAVQSYLPVGTNLNVRLGPSISASGDVYRNEYGVLVLSDADGNTPIMIATPHILRIFTTGDPSSSLKMSDGKRMELKIAVE